jgi:hypothetical protein
VHVESSRLVHTSACTDSGQPTQGLPDNLLPYLRLAHAESEVEVSCCSQGVRDLKQVHMHALPVLWTC